VQEGHVQIYWPLFATDATKFSAGITIHNTSRVSTTCLFLFPMAGTLIVYH